MSEKAPAFQFYPKDYLSDERVLVMSLAQRGTYIQLLSHQWLHGTVPDDLGAIAAICWVSRKEMEKVWPGVEACFPVAGPGRRSNPRMARDQKASAEYRESKSRAGKAGAANRWQSHASVNALPLANDSSPSPTASASPSAVGSLPTPSQVRHGEPGEHERLTKAYVALLKEAAAEMGGHADVLHAKAGRTPGGPAPANYYAFPTIPWLKTATEKLRAMLADHRADQADRQKPPLGSRAHLGAATPEEIQRSNRDAEADLARMRGHA